MSSKNKNEKVVELSVEETNKLRAELGLAPLRVRGHSRNETRDEASFQQQQKQIESSGSSSNNEKVVEMSIEESNALRGQLGLAPLRTGSSSGSHKKPVVHAPATNEAEQKRAADRIQQAKLRRQVQQGIDEIFSSSKGLGEEVASAKSWAAQMRQAKKQTQLKDTKERTAKSEMKYDEEQLKGMNVAHSISELQEGTTTVLTLSDAPLLATKDDTSQKVVGLNEDQVQLENVNLAEARKVSQGLKEKRKLELGMGRAGGYAGFDDDEFEELGGTQGPSRLARGATVGPPGGTKGTAAVPRGFQIGAHLEEQEEQLQSDLFAAEHGKSVSLANSHADVTASDFMTMEEDEALKQERKKKKKDTKFKKSKKKSKKDKKKSRNREESDEEAEAVSAVKPQAGVAETKKDLLDELEETAVEKSASRKRRRADDENTAQSDSKQENKTDKRARYDAIMDKGNVRTRDAFQSQSVESHKEIDEEPDDAFLNAALDKARRLNRLKALSKPSEPRGADAVVEAVKSSQNGNTGPVASTGTIEFSVDETREFTRALRARKEQAVRTEVKKVTTVEEDKEKGKEDVNMKVDVPMEEVDLHELAKEVKEEPEEDTRVGLDGTGSTAPVGRGLGNILSFLKQTGELTRKNAGKEELRGRARDKKTYEDYESINLSDVVKIDKRTATEKDKEFARREVKLEYRDKHGRLLTRKEAFRDLSYHFHGHGSGKRKEEKRLQQIEQEQAAARFASRQASEGAGAGTFGALKATQKATGKAFVVHKTQS